MATKKRLRYDTYFNEVTRKIQMLPTTTHKPDSLTGLDIRYTKGWGYAHTLKIVAKLKEEFHRFDVYRNWLQSSVFVTRSYQREGVPEGYELELVNVTRDHAEAYASRYKVIGNGFEVYDVD